MLNVEFAGAPEFIITIVVYFREQKPMFNLVQEFATTTDVILNFWAS